MKRSVSASEVARHLDLSAQRFGVMVNDGVFKRATKGRFDIDACRIAYIRWLRAAPQRNSRSAATSRIQEVKLRTLELNLAREEGELIPLNDVELTVEDILSTYVSELAGLAASCTRDMAVRAAIEENLDAAINRCRQRFEEAIAALGRGEAAVEDEPEAAA